MIYFLINWYNMWTYRAWFIVAVYVLASLILGGILIAMPNQTTSNGTTISGTGIAFTAFIVLILSGILVAFDTNCVIEGSCEIWGWIKTALYTINPIVIIIGAIMLYQNGSLTSQ